jgi:hypothetical protein
MKLGPFSERERLEFAQQKHVESCKNARNGIIVQLFASVVFILWALISKNPTWIKLRPWSFQSIYNPAMAWLLGQVTLYLLARYRLKKVREKIIIYEVMED